MDPVRELVRLLPKLVVQAMALEENSHLQDVAELRFDYGTRERKRLEDLAQGFGGMTRERVRQLEKMVLDRMRGVLVEDNFTARPYHIAPEVIAAFAPLWSHVTASAANAIPEAEFDRSLMVTFDLDNRDVRRTKDLLLGLARIERIQFSKDDLDNILYIEPFPFAFDPQAVIPAIHDVLFHSADATRLSTILVEINRHMGRGKAIGRHELQAAIRLCSTVEEFEDGLYRCRFETLRRHAQIERDLVEKGEPMAVADIWRVMNQRLVQQHEDPVTERNIANLLNSDERSSHRSQWPMGVENLGCGNEQHCFSHAQVSHEGEYTLHNGRDQQLRPQPTAMQ